ncbi:subtilisin-like protein [Lactarius vividus]|nr:subtilisin-like protein [Lactarius vividus]
MRYHWLYALSFLTATPLADFATPLAPWADVRVKHAWSSVPANWETLGCPSAGTTIDLYIALNPHQEDALIDALYQVSDPKHPRHVHLTAALLTPSSTYGAHLSKEQVAELVRPHPDTVELVTSWLAHYGVRPSSISTTHGGAWLTANEMLGASYQLYRHAEVNDTIIRTVSYSLPEVLHAHIQAIAPTTYFASTWTQRQTPHRRSVGAAAEATSGKPVRVLSSRADMVTPSQLRWLYKTFGYIPTAADRNALGPPSLATFAVELVNGGGYDPANPGDEANLDVQYTSAMAYPTPIIFYSIGGSGRWVTKTGEPVSGDEWLESFNYLLKKTVIPQTISISYGGYERNSSAGIYEGPMHPVCTARRPWCDDGVGKNCKDESGNVRFVAQFPASCPYLTAVGGTTDYDPEIAAPLSGGGFSDYFPRPVYQDVAVSAFLERQGTQYAGLYNPEGRGIPDIAAQAVMLPMVVKNDGSRGGWHELLGSLAGIISLLNDYLITNGRPPLGFLNIRLYDDGFAGLNDITSGSNPGCDTNGFSAVPGWDPVTGLGTPDFEKLQNIFMIPLGGGTGQGHQPKIRGPGE